MRVVISTEDDLKHRTGHGWISIFESVAEVPNDLLDGSVHQDTVAGTVVQGDLIKGNATPLWARLARGTANQLLRTNAGATDIEWATISTGATPGTIVLLNNNVTDATTTFATTETDIVSFTVASNAYTRIHTYLIGFFRGASAAEWTTRVYLNNALAKTFAPTVSFVDGNEHACSFHYAAANTAGGICKWTAQADAGTGHNILRQSFLVFGELA